ncbi:unnamed protein product [Rhizopus stolonifer]
MTISENLVESDKDVSNVVDIICYNNEKILTKVNAALFGVSGSAKAKRLIERALDFNAASKRKYCQAEDLSSDSSLEPLPKLKGKRKEKAEDKKKEDLDFIINFKEKMTGKMNWKACLSAAHEENVCQTYSTELNSKQPDFGENTLENSNWVGPVLVGEVKGEDRKDDVYMCLVDLYRISSLSMESINHIIIKAL